jgi:hypothetical protein
MKISVITITCREAPRLTEAARTLAASLARTPEVTLQWLIVDEKGRSILELTGMKSPALGDRMTIESLKPPMTEHRQGPDKAVAHNTARNAGLFKATGEYVVLLNDCNVVTMDWIAVARDCSLAGVGWRCKTDPRMDMVIPADGIVKHRGHHDLLHPVPPATVAGACWGAPRASFEAIHGFDLAYDGQRKGNDIEAVIRMARTGLKYVTTERALTIQLRRTKVDQEITHRKDVCNGVRNQALLNDLKRDTNRILPLVEARPPRPVAPVVVSVKPTNGAGAPPPVPGDARSAEHAPKAMTD